MALPYFAEQVDQQRYLRVGEVGKETDSSGWLIRPLIDYRTSVTVGLIDKLNAD
jgi:hypothetical protein